MQTGSGPTRGGPGAGVGRPAAAAACAAAVQGGAGHPPCQPGGAQAGRPRTWRWLLPRCGRPHALLLLLWPQQRAAKRARRVQVLQAARQGGAQDCSLLDMLCSARGSWRSSWAAAAAAASWRPSWACSRGRPWPRPGSARPSGRRSSAPPRSPPAVTPHDIPRRFASCEPAGHRRRSSRSGSELAFSIANDTQATAVSEDQQQVGDPRHAFPLPLPRASPRAPAYCRGLRCAPTPALGRSPRPVHARCPAPSCAQIRHPPGAWMPASASPQLPPGHAPARPSWGSQPVHTGSHSLAALTMPACAQQALPTRSATSRHV